MIHRRLGGLFHRVGAFAESAQAYYSGLEIEPHNVDLRLGFARALVQLEKTDQAAAQYRMIMKEHPDEPQAHLGLGLMLLGQGNEAEGRLHLRRAAALSPKLGLDIYRALKIDVFGNEEDGVPAAK